MDKGDKADNKKNTPLSSLKAIGIILALAAVFIFGPMLFISAVGKIEGFGSVLMLIAGILLFRVFSKKKPGPINSRKGLYIGFYAIIACGFDQTGNLIYNKPIEMVCCPENTSLQHRVDVSHPLPGRTYFSQNFTCYNSNNIAVKQLEWYESLSIRFIEYVCLAYLLIALRFLFWKWRMTKVNHEVASRD
jgi:hypothetical protein